MKKKQNMHEHVKLACFSCSKNISEEHKTSDRKDKSKIPGQRLLIKHHNLELKNEKLFQEHFSAM